jgi:YD repeat-containing protein
MVAIFTGTGTGAERGSAGVLGASGLLGSGVLGRSGESVLLNAANGNLMITQSDEFLVGRGPDVSISRTYNSQGNFSDENGDNWRQGTDRRVFGLTGTVNTAGSTVKRRSGDGSEISYAWDGSAYVTKEGGGAYDKLAYTTTGSQWVWTDGDSRITETYAADGGEWRIVEQADTSGNKLTFTYSGTRLSRVTTADGGYTQYLWSGNNIAQITTGYTEAATNYAKVQVRTRYSYDTSNRLSTVTVDLTPGDSAIADAQTYTTTYTYVGTSKLVASITEKDGSSLAIGYDGSNRVSTLTQTVASGVTRVTSIVYGTGFTEITDPTSQVTRLDYDVIDGSALDGYLTKITAPPATSGATAQTVEFGYNATTGDVTSVKDAAGQTTSYTHLNGNVATEVDRLLAVVERTYDANNQVVTETRTGADQNGAAGEHTTRYVYDTASRLRYVVGAEGRVTEYRYDGYGQLVSEIAYTGTVYTHALAKNVGIAESALNGWVSGTANRAAALRTDTAYDLRGNVRDIVRYSTLNAAGEGIASPLTIATGINTTVVQLPDGLYRITKTSGAAATWDADARSSTKAEGDFVVQVRAGQSNAWAAAGVAPYPALNAGNTNINYGFQFSATGQISAMEPSAYTALGTYVQGDTFWLTRTGTTVNYYKGATLEAAVAAGTLRTVTGATGTMYFDSAVRDMGSKIEAAFLLPVIVNGANTIVSMQTDGLYRISKPSTGSNSFDADARSTTMATGDFVLRFRPGQNTAWIAAGVAGNPAESSDNFNINYGFLLDSGGGIMSMEPAIFTVLPGTYGAGDSFWLTRAGTTVSYYKGATLEAAVANGALHVVTGSTGTVYFDSSIATAGAYMDVAFTPAPPVTAVAGDFSRTNFVYDQAGRLLSQVTAGEKQQSFVYDGMGRVIGSTDMNGGTSSIVFNDVATQTVVTLANGYTQTSTYNKAGELISHTDAGDDVAGGTTTYKYDANGRVRQMTDALGNNSYYLYDKADRKAAEINQYGWVAEYRYDANDRLVATVRYNGLMASSHFTALLDPNSTIEIATIRPTATAADIWTWTIYDKEGRVVEAVQGDGSVTGYSYDASGRLVETRSYRNKLGSARLTAFKAAAPTLVEWPAAIAGDSVSRIFYDKDGRVVGTLNGEGELTRIGYDAAGQKILEQVFANAPTAATTATFAVLLASVAASIDDRTSRYVYDAQGLLRYTIDGLNHIAEFVYESAVPGNTGALRTTIQYAGTITSPTTFTYSTVKAAIVTAGLAISAANRSNWAVYDNSGRLAYAMDAAGAVVGYSYDTMGQVIKAVQYATPRTTATLPSHVDMVTWIASNASAANDRITRNYYSDRGELIYSVDALGYVTQNGYDANGQKILVARYDAAVVVTDASTIATIATAVNSAARTTNTYSYDTDGRVYLEYDGEGKNHYHGYNANGTRAWTFEMYDSATDESRTLYDYDATGRLTALTTAGSSIDAATTFYAYDGQGNLTTITDGNGNVTTRAYDKLGRMISQTDALLGFVQYQYDAFGDVTRTIDARNNSTYFAYDKLGRVVSQTDALTGIVAYDYTAFGETARVTDARNNATYHYYDKLGRVTTSRDAENYLTETAYTVFGSVASVTRRLNATTAALSLTTVPTATANDKDATTGFEYNELGRLTKTIDAEGHYEAYTLDAFGNRIQVRNKVGGVTVNTYDRRGLLLTETLPMTSTNAAGTVSTLNVTNKFTYDGRGNRTQMIEAFGFAEARTTTYVYDATDRLIRIEGQARSVLAAADGALIDNVVPTQYFTYDDANQLVESIDALGARTLYYYDQLGRKSAQIVQTGATTGTYSVYGYDANGNLTSSKVYAASVTLPASADPLLRPAAPTGEVRETTYVYDVLDRLTSQSVANVRTGVLVGTGTSAAYALSTAPIVTSYVYDAAGNVIRTIDANLETTHSFYDRVGRKTAEVDRGNYLTSWTFDAEGNVLSETRWTNQPGTLTATAPTVAAATATDRTTQFTYDRNGNRLTEKRLAVDAYTVHATTGALTSATSDSGITYAYNALGQVRTKTEATGDIVEYTYDLAGRLIQEKRAGFVDVAAATMRPTTRYAYDGLNNLTVTRQGGETVAAGDRITRNSYTAGLLASTVTAFVSETNAAILGAVTVTYAYDKGGNVLRESYNRRLSNDTTVLEARLYVRDILGRITEQSIAAKPGTAWVKGDTQNTQFNAYGEVAQRGINGLWQESFAYDLAGRVVKTNAGDGVWRFFLYDKAGNQTLTIESEGTDLSAVTLDGALNLATGTGAHAAGSAYLDGITVTINAYSKRGQATETRAMQRQLSATGTPQDLTVSRTYNAFGEVASQTDAFTKATTYGYNTMGRNTSVTQTQVTAVGENGLAYTVSPVTYIRYDISGRAIGTTDALGHSISRQLLAGTGYGGGEALVATEFHPDGGVVRNAYDVFGDLRKTTEPTTVPRITQMVYDAMGRVTQITKPGGLVEYYAYDLHGQRIRHWNNFLVGTGSIETTDYDSQGRVVSQVVFGGDTTTTGYVWSGYVGSVIMGTMGSWTQTTTYANGLTLVEKSDVFGHDLEKTDLGGNITTYVYDMAGRVDHVSGHNAALTTWSRTNSWLNTGQLSALTSIDGGVTTTATYEYDRNGNRTVERQMRGGVWIQYASASYDDLGRMATWAETAGTLNNPAASKAWSYDAVGNIRHITATYRQLDRNGVAGTAIATDHLWYRYDAMNRAVISGGTLDGTTITKGSGVELLYNAVGERVRATTVQLITNIVRNPFDDIYDERDDEISLTFGGDIREDYAYDAAGHLVSVYISQSATDYNYELQQWVNYFPYSGAGAEKASFAYDAMGRLYRQIDYTTDPYSTQYIAYDRTIMYNNAGQSTYEVAVTRQGDDTLTNYTWIYYIDDETGEYALGAAFWSEASSYKNNNYQSTTTSTNTFAWYEGAVQATIEISGATSSSSLFHYSASGVLSSIGITDARSRTVTLTNDINGQAIRRDEVDGNHDVANGGDPHEIWYRFAGKQLGSIGNNGTLETDYTHSIASRTSVAGTGAFQGGDAFGGFHADFDQSYDPVTSYAQGSSGGAYRVRAGDTLAGIATSLWGDGALWYKLAEANGLSGASALIEGQTLNVPSGVQRSSNSASTFAVYEPSEAIGDLSPAVAKPAGKKNKCGVFGQILLAVIAIAVTAFTYGALGGVALTGWSAVGAGALAGAAGSVVSQGVGLATGLQDKFSFKGVALAALGGAVGGALKGFEVFSNLGKLTSLANDVARGALSSGITQGIGVATGLQDNFSWAGVAASGVLAGVGGAVGRGLASTSGFLGMHAAQGSTGGQFVSGMASGLAGAATRSVIEGSDFGDNILAMLPDVIGNTIGSWAADKMASLTERAHYASMSAAEIADETREQLYSAVQRKHGTEAAANAVEGLGPQILADARGIRAAIEQGVSLRDPAALRSMQGGTVSTSAEGSENMQVDANPSFGDKVATAGLAVQSWIEQHPDWATALNYGVTFLKGGPVGLVTDYAISQVISAGLSATGADAMIREKATEAGQGVLGFLHSGEVGGSSLDNEKYSSQFEANPGSSARSIIAFAGTVLGVASIAGVALKISAMRTAAKGLVDEAHVAELVANGVKFTPDALLATGRNAAGRVVFLESGNARAGLQHIVEQHGADFAKIGVPEADIPSVVMRAVTEGKVVGYQGRDQGRAIYEILLHQQNQRIAVSVGNNGFIVGANPAGRVP